MTGAGVPQKERKEMELNKNALTVLEKRYLIKDENGNVIETPEELFRRVAKKVASVEKEEEREGWEEDFYTLMTTLQFLPNTPVLSNFGKPGVQQQGSACFVIKVGDSIEEIFEALKQSALIMKTGGGVGYSFGRLRPEGANVAKHYSLSTGPLGFMEIFNISTEIVKQGQSARRGAQMGILPVDHPDIEKFIHVKDDLTKLTNFNISVAITDEFISAYKENREYDLIDPRTRLPYEIKGVVQRKNARDIMHQIATSATQTGEPGIVFIDRANQTNPVPSQEIVSTNPCCCPGWELILTKEHGFVYISQVIGKSVTIWNGYEWSSVIPFYAGRSNELFEVSVLYSENKVKSITCTSNHRFFMADQTFVESQNLKIGDKLFPQIVLDDLTVLDTPVTVLAIRKHHDSEKLIYEDVYCVTEPLRGTVCFGGIITGNSEQFLPDFDSCTLGSINVSKFVWEGKTAWVNLKSAVHKAIRFLDNVLDCNEYPIPQIAEQTLGNRRVGLGIMGFADYLIKLGIQYDSDTGIEAAKSLMSFIQREAKYYSNQLAEEKGCFPNWEISTHKTKPMRNAMVTTCAPTGSISIFAGCSGGIEPLYAVCFQRRQAGELMTDVNPLFEQIAKERGFYSKELMDKIAHSGSVQDITEVPEDVKKLFRVASDISPRWHIDMQAAFQQHIDNAISKTINFDNKASVADIEDAYIYAYDQGCKSVSVYRDGCRPNQVLSVGKTTSITTTNIPMTIPDEIDSRRFKINTSFGKIYLTVGYLKDPMRPVEILFKMDKRVPKDMRVLLDSLARNVSVALKYNTPITDIIKQLKRAPDGTPIVYNKHIHSSISELTGSILSKMFLGKDEEIELACEKCHGKATYQSGCLTCLNPECGYSKCG